MRLVKLEQVRSC